MVLIEGPECDCVSIWQKHLVSEISVLKELTCKLKSVTIRQPLSCSISLTPVAHFLSLEV